MPSLYEDGLRNSIKIPVVAKDSPSLVQITTTNMVSSKTFDRCNIDTSDPFKQTM